MKNRRWFVISEEFQRAYDSKNSKALYTKIKRVYAPATSTVVPLKSKDGSSLLRDAEGFTDLFDNPSEID